MPDAAEEPAARIANWLAVMSMAALGPGVDVRVVARAGVRVAATVVPSPLLLLGRSLGMIRLLGLD